MAKKLWFGYLLAVLCVALLAALASQSVGTAQAQTSRTRTPTPTPTPTSVRPVWARGGIPGLPVNLENTGGGGVAASVAPPGYCTVIMEETPLSFEVAPPTVEVVLDAPLATSHPLSIHVDGALYDSDSLKVYLQAPDGHRVELDYHLHCMSMGTYIYTPTSEDPSAVAKKPALSIGYTYQHAFDESAQTGDYTIVAQLNDEEVFRRTVAVSAVDWLADVCRCPHFFLTQAGVPAEGNAFVRGDRVDLTFEGYQPNEQLVLSLLDYTLPEFERPVSWWEVAIDEEGKGTSSLTIPDDAPLGEYALLAVGEDSWDYSWDFLEGGFGQSSYENFFRKFTVLPASSEPLDAAIAYFESIDSGVAAGDFAGAYNLLSRTRQVSRSYADFAAGFATTRQVAIESATIVTQNSREARAHLVIRATDEIDNRLIDQRYDVIYRLVYEDNAWKLDWSVVHELP